jgi:alpha-L-glutamate ligase-like protein
MKFFSHGILWMNARNLLYIQTKNTSEWISLADSKLKTKHFLSSRGIPFAETYFTIASKQDLQDFSFQSIYTEDFVIKPNKWSGWKGILIVTKAKDGYLIQNEIWTEDEIRLHMIDILHGSFSLHGSSDIIVIEELLTPWRDFSCYCKYGLADIRIIVYNYVPITAMIRMPTVDSGWKANLAQWWIWLGLNIANGQVISLFQDKKIHTHTFPIEYERLWERVLPFWDDILLFSSQVQMYTKLGYLALDWVITKNGPKLLEINARAGLEIQNVNLVPLASRLKKVEDIKILSPEKWVEIAKSLFHTETLFSEKEKKILYLEQKGIIWDKEVSIEIDMTKKFSYISWDIAESLWSQQVHILTDLNVGIVLDHFEILPSGNAKVILWMESIREYLINPSVYTSERRSENDTKWTKELIDFDDAVYRISKKVNLSSLLRPDNFFELLDIFIQNPFGYNPVFQYHFPNDSKIQSIRDTLENLMKKAQDLKSAWVIIAELYIEKIEEIENKLSLVEAYKNENFPWILQYNTILFWKTDETLFQISKEKVFKKKQTSRDDALLWKILTLDQVIYCIHAYFEKLNIKKIPITIESGNLSRMSVSYGKEVRIHISKNAVIRKNEMDAILSHEIGTHFRRYLAGKDQWLKLFQFGTGYYLADEEGFAIHRSFSHLPDGYEKNAMYIKYYLLEVADTLSFSETIELLRTLYPQKTLESIFSDAVRLKRWITHSGIRWTPGTTYQKDKIYLDGYMRVKKWLEMWGNSDILFFWKIKIQDLKTLELL